MIRVIVAYDAQLMRSALVELLRSDGALDVSAASCIPRRQERGALSPDVCVADADSLEPSVRGSRAALSEACSEGALLVLASPEKPGVLRKAFNAGALGYVDKDCSPCRLLEAIHTVAKGERFIDESLAFGFLQAAEMPLTPRELSVLSLAAEGATIAEVAGDLHLSQGTIRNYMASVIRKIGARNRVDAIRIAQGAGWT
ncbi:MULTISPECIES: response regulator transcription factor [unclassified Streptomyces]|uniref:response regulator transcription factor n=1 Tax=unclassified Streptomyces TaxID=2593676 RepID=UPI0028C413F3|nr:MULTISPECIES: response regulator transcription factor [unclassified Streptomyces]WNO76411.1 response regulator transcription factor [Streptomyces sp. AM8-1-1]